MSTGPGASTSPSVDRNYLDERLGTLLKYLPALRAEGVSCLRIDGMEVLLRPIAPNDEVVAPHEPPAGRDPMTYGLPPGVKMPSLRDRR